MALRATKCLTRPKLLLVDGLPLAFRAFHGPGTQKVVESNDGRDMRAVFGVHRILVQLLRQHKPTHFCVVYDGKSSRDTRCICK